MLFITHRWTLLCAKRAQKMMTIETKSKEGQPKKRNIVKRAVGFLTRIKEAQFKMFIIFLEVTKHLKIVFR